MADALLGENVFERVFSFGPRAEGEESAAEPWALSEEARARLGRLEEDLNEAKVRIDDL